MNRRTAILSATGRASDIYARHPLGSRTSVDVVRLVASMDIPLLYRPLGSLWGAALTVDSDLSGILVTSKLDPHVQRFTLAHELGHIVLGHGTSLDESVDFSGRFGDASQSIEEFAANTFASELLAPKSLLVNLAKKHHWNKAALADPSNVYQLALRLGLSFPATCWALVAHDALTQQQAKAYQKRGIKELKQKLATPATITNSWADVWSLTSPDTGTYLEAGPDDLFAVHLKDQAGAGYLWRLVDVSANVETIADTELMKDGEHDYGGSTTRVVHLRVTAPGVHRLAFEHCRPWNGHRIGHIDISVDNYGKEVGGFPRHLRAAALDAVGL